MDPNKGALGSLIIDTEPALQRFIHYDFKKLSVWDLYIAVYCSDDHAVYCSDDISILKVPLYHTPREILSFELRIASSSKTRKLDNGYLP